MSASAGRKAKVEQALRDTLAELIAREVKDPRVHAAGLLSVTRVECNVDLSVANVYVSVFQPNTGPTRRATARSGADAKSAVAGLQAAAGFLRGPAGRALNMRHPPELRFVYDESAQVTLDLASIIREDEEKARAAGRVPGEAATSGGAPPKLVEEPDVTAETQLEDADDTTTEREPTKVLDDEPTADLHPTDPAPPGHASREDDPREDDR